jgi:large subunit ribosomal protein L19
MDVEAEFLRKDQPEFRVGDTVDVGVKIRELTEKTGKGGGLEEKERVQIFNGVVIARQGQGSRETFTVRRIVAGEGVERVFPVHSPRIAGIKVKSRGRVRRAKLYYLRDRVGKATKLDEILGALSGTDTGSAKG